MWQPLKWLWKLPYQDLWWRYFSSHWHGRHLGLIKYKTIFQNLLLGDHFVPLNYMLFVCLLPSASHVLCLLFLLSHLLLLWRTNQKSSLHFKKWEESKSSRRKGIRRTEIGEIELKTNAENHESQRWAQASWNQDLENITQHKTWRSYTRSYFVLSIFHCLANRQTASN